MTKADRLALSRRGVLITAAGAGLALPAMLAAGVAHATGPAVSPFRRAIGGATVTPLLDGFFDVETAYWTGIAAADVAAAAHAAFLDPAAPIRIGIAAWLVRVGAQTVLVDAGAGALFGTSGGRLLEALAADGATPADIDAVLVGHMHPDHIGGLLAGDRPAFPRAELIVAEADHRFWTDPAMASRAPEGIRGWFGAARAVADAHAGRLTLVADGASPVSGFTAVALPGHTPGHTAWRLETGGDTVLFWSDTALVAPVQFARPDAMLVFDADPEAARASRLRAFGEAAEARSLVTGTHLPFPGFGHVARQDGAFAWVSAVWPYA